MNKGDIKFLLSILEEHHKKVNVVSIDKCPESNCWYKKIKKELKLQKHDSNTKRKEC